MWKGVTSKVVRGRGGYNQFLTCGRRSISTTPQLSQHSPGRHMDKKDTDTPVGDSSEELKQRLRIQFSCAKLGRFTQSPPRQENPFTNNAFLISYLTRVFPQQVRESVWDDLTRFGERAVTEIYLKGRACELNQPYVKTYDAWGNRTDELVTCQEWKDLKKISAEEGLIASAYEGKYGEYDRLYQMVKLFLFSPVSGLYSCPLAMTDGAAKTATVTESSHLRTAYQHLTSRDPEQFWTSGQWMTEKQGGSDVSGATETVAVQQADGFHQLFGYKWFSSATDADMSLTLANIISLHQPEPKPRGLTMFYLETRNGDGKLNGLEIVKLKNKLGTRQLPTAELLLDGTVAHQVCPEGRGIASIANMLTITRMHNAISSASVMRRIIQLARDYSKRRFAFGQGVQSHILHQVTAARMEVVTRGCEVFALHMARLLGRQEAGVATEEESLVFRTLNPILKFFTAKKAMEVTSEGLECFGGQGYIEDTGLPSHLRDAQVLPIWEGTTNILSLDFLRAVTKSKGDALRVLHDDIKDRVGEVRGYNGPQELEKCCDEVMGGMKSVITFLEQHPHLIHAAARDIAQSIAHIYIGSLLLDHAAWEKSPNSLQTVKIWCDQPLTLLTPHQYTADNHSLVMEGYRTEQVYGPMF